MPRGSRKLRRWCKSKHAKGWKINQYHVLKNKCCAICGVFMAWRQVTIDHVIPLGSGGEDCESNAQLAHEKCNNRKGSGEHE
jgi:5-methylcytosine-specific restriction endonuclease McrA